MRLSMFSSTFLRIFCTSSTKFSLLAACHTNGVISSKYLLPSSKSPALKRAFNNAWNSQVLAQRW